MKLRTYLRDKSVLIFMLVIAIFFTSVLLRVLNINFYTIFFIIGVYLLALCVGFGFDFWRRREFYNEAKKEIEHLDKKYLFCEVVEPPGFFEGDFLCEILYQSNKSMADEIARYREAERDYREYIETWVHEVKTPIASAGLIYENNKQPALDNMYSEVMRIEDFVNQALFYCRSGSVEKDYIVKRCSLDKMVKEAVRHQSRSMIESKVKIRLENLDQNVYTDRKWVEFMLGQFIANAVRYRSEQAEIIFYAQKLPQSVRLSISDNGIGIPDYDLARVFEKGFTGENGRKYQKSTGMGLYLCKKLADKLGLGISVTSVKGKGTTVSLVFPISSMYEESRNE